MKVKAIEWQGVRVPLRESFATSAGVLGERYSLLLWLHTDTGVTGIGEAPSAVGGGEAGLKRLAATLQQLFPSLPGTPIEQAGRWARERMPHGPEVNSLRFALETAACDTVGQIKGLPVASLLGGEPCRVPVNAVVGATSPQRASSLAERAVLEGFTTLKFKVGGRAIQEDEAMLEAVRSTTGNETKLRLDANQAWEVEEAISCIRRLASFGPEYIEEPVRPGDLTALARVRRSSPTPIAADESLENRDAASRVIKAGAADVLVVKAARVGGLQEAQAIVAMAIKKGGRVIITSSLETGVGLAASLHLAAATLGEKEVCGLATGLLLGHDLLTTPLLPHKGSLHLPPLPGLGIKIDKRALQRYRVGMKGKIAD